MATILTKRSNTASSVPVAGDLTNSTGGAELAVNTADKRLFTKDSGGTVVELGTNPSSVTLPNGTANGVPYLNGSKVLTSGSALTFDGTRLAIGGGTNGGNFTVRAAGAMAGFDTGTTNDGRIEYAYNGTNIFYTGIDSTSLMTLMARSGVSLAFGANGSEQMRLTSTGLGIGTSSPSVKLDVVTADNAETARFKGASGYIKVRGYVNGSYGGEIAAAGAYPLSIGGNTLRFYTGGGLGTPAMYLDNSGNVGIGTSSPASKLQVTSANGAVTLDSGTGESHYIDINHKGSYNSVNGIRFKQNSTTYGNNQIDFLAMDSGGTVQTVMTLNGSGNLGLGVTPSAWHSTYVKALQIGDKGSALSGFTSSLTSIHYTNLSTNAYYDAGGWKYIATDPASLYQQANQEHRWLTAPSGTAGNAISFTQAMTLDASGNLGVGVTSPGARLEVFRATGNTAGTYEIARFTAGSPSTGGQDFGGQINLGNNGGTYYSNAAITWGIDAGQTTYGWLSFKTANNNTLTERIRIDYNGNLLVGVTSFSAGVRGKQINQDNYNSSWDSTNSRTHVQFMNPNGTVGSITTAASATTYATSSDYRLKNTIAPMTGALAKVAALKPCTYKWNVDGSDGEGFIAHELAEVCPDAVIGEKDAVDAEGNPVYQGIDTSFLVATLTAALQELKAEVDALKSEINTLKGI